MRRSICDRPSTSKGKRNQLKHAQERKDIFLIPVYREYVHIIKQSANNNNPTHVCIFLCTKTAGQIQRLMKHNDDSEGKKPQNKTTKQKNPNKPHKSLLHRLS